MLLLSMHRAGEYRVQLWGYFHARNRLRWDDGTGLRTVTHSRDSWRFSILKSYFFAWVGEIWFPDVDSKLLPSSRFSKDTTSRIAFEGETILGGEECQRRRFNIVIWTKSKRDILKIPRLPREAISTGIYKSNRTAGVTIQQYNRQNVVGAASSAYAPQNPLCSVIRIEIDTANCGPRYLLEGC